MGHRRLRTIIGDVKDDRKAGPAVRAVDEWVSVTPVLRIQHLTSAVFADSHIGRNWLKGLGDLSRFQDFETVETVWGSMLHAEAIDPG